MHIIVLGADGRLSQAVSRAALEADHTVVGVTRSGRMRRPIEGVSVRAADALNKAALVAACRDADVVFNGLNPPYPRWSAAALPMARNVLAACRAANAGQLFAGNVYNHGEAMPERLMPDTPQRPSTRKGRIRAEMEALFEAAAPEVATTVLRACPACRTSRRRAGRSSRSRRPGPTNRRSWRRRRSSRPRPHRRR